VVCGATSVLASRAAAPIAPARLRIALATDASELAGDPNGPLGLLSVSAWLIVEVTVMVAAAALATITTLRGWRGERKLAAT
jgi:hypothetical protein